MHHPRVPRWIAEAILVILGGLGLGFGLSLAWKAAASPGRQETGSQGATQPMVSTEARISRNESRVEQPDKSLHQRALLVGVTRYDHLPRDRHLEGPGNDVLEMRRVLRELYRFPPEGIVTLSEAEGNPDRRPTRSNIEREFRSLSEQVSEGDQVVVLLAGHGSQEPENSPDPAHSEPDGLDEIFLPADVSQWKATPGHVPNAIRDNDLGAWLRAIAAKRAYVWAIFDCCHSGTMTRGTEVVRELPPELLVPREELAKARQRAAERGGRTRGGPIVEPISFIPPESSEFLVALYACRPHEVTPECLQPADSPDAHFQGLLTYSLLEVLTRSADARSPLTYRELARRLQVQYSGRPQGAPTPMIEGKGQDRIVLGTQEVIRSPLLLTRDREGYKVNSGDLYGLTPGSILAVESSTIKDPDGKGKILGHVRVVACRPFDSTVEPCEFEGSPLVKDLASNSTCRVAQFDLALRRFRVAIVLTPEEESHRLQVVKALQSLLDAKNGLIELVLDPRKADWIIRVEKGKFELVEASGNRAPFALPSPDNPSLVEALKRDFEKIYRAHNLVAVASRFESERDRGATAVNVDVEVLRHRNPSAPGEVFQTPKGGRVLRPGDLISFRLHNNSPAMKVDVTLLVVGSDYEIHAFYPQAGELGQSLDPGQSISTPPPPGEISADPPFGPESLVLIATPATNPPVDFTALVQGGLPLARAADSRGALKSPLGQLLESAMFRTGSRGPMKRTVSAQHGMRVLNWRTQPN